jgi:hypothetical protein
MGMVMFPWLDHQQSLAGHKLLAELSVLDTLKGMIQKKGSSWSSRLTPPQEKSLET